jgi:hypothetical protein
MDIAAHPTIFTSPRLRGEVGVRAMRGRRVRGRGEGLCTSKRPLTRLAALPLATLSPHAGKGNTEVA